MNVLELFCGTKSVGKVCDKLGWDSVSVDLEKKFNPTHTCSIMDFDYKKYPKDYFSIVWASPPCTNYSLLQNCNIGRMRKGVIYTKEIQEKEMLEDDKLVLKTLEIIKYFNPHYWFIENPAFSRMKDRPFMKDLNNYVVDYCMYSDWGYRKRTRIWTNRTDFIPKLCNGSGDCGNMINSIHKTNLGNADNFKRKKHIRESQNGSSKNICKGTSQKDRYRIPEDLIFSLFLE